MALLGNGYLLQEETRRLGHLTVREAIAVLDSRDPASADALRALGEPWLDRLVWVRGSGSRLTVEQERPVQTVATRALPWQFSLETRAGAPYVRITAE